MKRIREYLRQAEECRKLAERMRSSEGRAMMLDMAASWEGLAEVREQSVRKKEG